MRTRADLRGIVSGMPFASLPVAAAWRHQDARSGFEVVFFHLLDDGYRVEGCTTAVQDSATWIVDYEIVVDAGPAGLRRIRSPSRLSRDRCSRRLTAATHAYGSAGHLGKVTEPYRRFEQLPSYVSDELDRLAGDPGDGCEVAIVAQQREPLTILDQNVLSRW